MHGSSLLGPLAVAAALAGCGPARTDVIIDPQRTPDPTASASASASAPQVPVRVSFEIPRDGAAPEIARTPWPTEMARKPDGRIDVRAYPGHDSALLQEYLTRAAEDLDGFSIAPVVFFHFEGPIDLDAIAAEDASRSAASAIVLADVDPASPEKGTLYPIALRATTRDMRYVRKGTLAVGPLEGFVLRPGTLYAAAVRRSFGGVAGGLATSLDLDAVLSKTPRTDAASERARALHAPAVAALEAIGVPREEIAGLAVFRTGSPHAVLAKMIDTLDGMFANASGAAPGAANDDHKSAAKGAATDDRKGTTSGGADDDRKATKSGGANGDRKAAAPPQDRAKSASKAATAKGPSPEEGAARTPRIVRAEWDASLGKSGLYRVIRGMYCTPNFQAHVESAPFLEHEGGRVLTDGERRPLVAPVPADAEIATRDCPGQIRARFVLSVPEAPAPKDGYPLLVTAHGTGGDAFSFLGAEDFAGWAALEGYAAISTDQPLNGGKDSGRPGAAGPLVLPLGIPVPPGEGGPPIAFYNPLYPGAARGNMQQAQADAAVLVRLFGGLDLGALRDDKKQPLFKGKGAPAPRLDGRRTVLAGHSQGCQSIAALGAVDPRARGVVLSGCGGDVRLGILRRRVMNLTSWVSLVLGLDPEEPSELHPLMALVQNLADPIDPLAFARYYWDPLPGHGPQKVLHYEGLRDSYNPEVAAEALAVALRAGPVRPLVKPIDTLALLGAAPAPDRQLLQIAPSRGNDGHFVLYHEPGASDAFRAFLRGAAPP